jgi:predicted DNA-binding transcriptional regulator AlpA
MRTENSAQPHELLLANEAAALLRTTPAVLATWRSTGRHAIPFVKVGRSVRYRRADLLEWLDAQARTATGNPQ